MSLAVLGVPLCIDIVTLSFAYSSESHPALKTSSRVFSESLVRGGKQFDIRETGPGRWCWHLIYILWPGLGGRTEWCMHARDSTQQQRASSHPMRDSDTHRVSDRYKFKLVGTCQHRAQSSSHPVMLSM